MPITTTGALSNRLAIIRRREWGRIALALFNQFAGLLGEFGRASSAGDGFEQRVQGCCFGVVLDASAFGDQIHVVVGNSRDAFQRVFDRRDAPGAVHAANLERGLLHMFYYRGMTTCQIGFHCPASLTEPQLRALEKLKGQLYGLRGFTENDGQLIVNYDASRLSPALVETELHRAGIPVTSSL